MNTIREEAARWFVRMCAAAPDDPERGRFEAWLSGNPAHAAAYAAYADMWADFNSEAHCQSLAQEVKAQQQSRRRALVKGGALGLLVAGVAGEFLHSWTTAPLWQITRHTGQGKLGHESLPDGSRLVLDAATALAVAYSRSERRVNLVTGRAIFDVAHDADRPFVVDSGAARVTVLGTRFVVDRLAEKVGVHVERGRVQVEAGPFWRRQRMVLEDGQSAEVGVAIDGSTSLRAVERKAAASFEFAQGMLVFERADLSEVAQTLSRYRNGPVHVAAHRAAAGPRITAGAPASKVENLIDLLPRIAAVEVRRNGDQVELAPR